MKNTNIKKTKPNGGRVKVLAIAALVLLGGLGSYWFFSQGDTNGYPKNVAGVLYNTPTVSSNSLSLPTETVKTNKLVFMDVKLETPQQQLTFKGRVIPLSAYRGGEYLPMIVVYTPKGNVVSGIRVCEPCGSFSFHIVEGKYLRCDLCGTIWDLETLKGVSGGCQPYPPPRLPSTLSDTTNIDLSSVGLRFA